MTEFLPALINDKLQFDFPALEPMLKTITSAAPEITKAIQQFGKTQSQFMDNFLTLAFPTPFRNLHQCLAQIEQVRMAIRESYYKNKKSNIEMRRKIKQLESEALDEFDRELIEVEIEEKKAEQESASTYLAGAVRRYSNYLVQYESIKKSLGLVDGFSEEDFERCEEEYHIKRAFEQGLHAARSHGGIIDEGNHIYLYQIGINGSAAQKDVVDYLVAEGKLADAGGVPTHESVISFLEKMYQKYKGSARRFGDFKNITSENKHSMFT